MANYAKAFLDTRPGILSCKVSVLTGSITVYYNPAETDALSILDLLNEGGIVSDSAATKPSGVPLRFMAPDKGVWFIANVVISLFLKSVVDHSVGSVFGRAVL